MSGFAGIISLDGAPPDTRLLERMAQTLAFRGPDGTHITTKPGAGFCFTFLRTGPAPQSPSQPRSLDGNVWLIGDVRLDGRNDLRRKLEQHGDEIEKDVTDEELVLRSWRRQRICVSLQANLVGEEYIWRWETNVRGNGSGPDRCFRQSTFQGANFTPQALRRRAADYVPSLSEEGQVDRWLLQAMDGTTSLQQMAQAAAERFPSIFPRWEDALHRAAELARQFSR